MREPDPSLWLKIQPPQADKLDTAGSDSKDLPVHRIKANKPLRWLRVAAAIAVIFAASSAGIWFLSGGNNVQDPLAQELYNEIMETEAYYASMVSARYNDLQPYLDADPGIGTFLRDDMEELDQAYEELKEDLKDDVSNPAVIEAMILNYSVKLEILEDLLYQLKEKENKDDEKDVSYAL